MTKEVKLSRNKVAIVDDEDFEKVSRYKWSASNPSSRNWYAIRNIRLPDGRKTTISMHTYLMGRLMVDHIDGNGLNNTRNNFRGATNQENCCNSCTPSNNTSGFKGVHFYGRTGRWQAYIHFNRKKIHLGYFDTAEEAAKAYDEAAIKYHGEFSRLNFSEK